MAEGRFSRPRPNRDENRQIEETFRQVTGQASEAPPKSPGETGSDPLDFSDLLSEDRLAEDGDERIRKIVSGEDLFDWDDEDEPETPRRGPKKLLLILCAAAAVLVIALIAVFFLRGSDPYDGKILSGVYLGNVNVGGMTKSEATAAMKTTAERYKATDMVVTVGEETLVFSPEDTGAQLNVSDAVNAAYDYGRKGTDREQKEAYAASKTENHTIGLLPYLKLDTNYIRSSLAIYAQQSGSTLTQTDYGMEGSRPNLSADKFDESTAKQTLIILKGTPGTGFDISQANDRVLDAYSLCSFAVTVEAVTTEAEPDPLDWDAVWEEYCVEPVDAQLDPDTLEPIAGSYGCEFDLEQAKAMLDSAQYGEEIRIPMVFTPPKEAAQPALDMDILGEYQTRYTEDADRVANLLLACQAIDGAVVEPDKVFSLNDCLGERTAQKGYKQAVADSAGEAILGGGISQVSSTLYYAALLSDLEIVSRTPHTAPASFVPYGLDADLGWPDTDFSFRNTTGFPLRLEAKLSGGSLTVRIYGTDQRDYYIRLEYDITATLNPVPQYINIDPNNNSQGYKNGDVIQEGATGYTVKTYRVKYSKETNALLSRDFETTTQYPVVNPQIARLYTNTPVQPEPQQPDTPHTPDTPDETTKPDDGEGGGSTEGGDQGGSEGGDQGGDQGGNQGGDQGGNQGGDQGGNQGGDQGGNQGGDQGGNQGGDQGGNQGGDQGGNQGGDQGGDQGSGEGGDQGGSDTP